MPEAQSDAREDPDAELLPAVAAGDARACSTLVDRHAGRVHGLASRLLGDAAEADDVSQEVFLAAWKHAGRWRPGGSARFSTWLTRVTLNACRDRLRSRRPTAPVEVLELLPGDAGPERRTLDAERVMRVRAAVAELPPRQREALVLCHYQGLRQDEAAAAMELSVDALESLLARARRALRLRLGGETA
jgi:RNA polymerase sigma-70 factor (ECF subfamily)